MNVISPVIVFIVVIVTTSLFIDIVEPIENFEASMVETVIELLPATDCMIAVAIARVREEELLLEEELRYAFSITVPGPIVVVNAGVNVITPVVVSMLVI